MIKTAYFKQTKTCLADLISTHAPTKSSVLQKSILFNWIQQPLLKPTNTIPIIYDNFIYTDKLTKKRIKMSDAKLSYQNGRHVRNSPCSSVSHGTQNQQKKKRPSRFARHNSHSQLQKQLFDLNECFLMLKSTEMFKLNSLRQKIFKSVYQTAKQTPNEAPRKDSTQQMMHGEIKEMYSKKKKIREILQDSVKQANMTQFRKYYSDQNHKVNNKIFSMNKHIRRSFNRSNIEKIIQTLSDADKKDDSICTFIKKEQEDVEFPGQQKLRTELIEYMKKLIRHNGQFLITPQKKKILYQRLYKNVVLKSNDLNDQEFMKNLTQDSVNEESHDKHIFDDQLVSSKIDINIPTQKSILQPSVNDQALMKKETAWSKSLRKTSHVKSTQKQKKKTQYPFIDKERKERHKKENTCINFTNQFKLKTKDSIKPFSEMSSFLNSFAFSPCEKNKQISMIKSKFEKNKRLNTTKLSLKQQRFLFMVENGLLFDVEKQILLNEDYLFMKDKNENNLLQICAKNHSTEMFTFIIERYVKCGLKQEMRQKWGKQILKDRLLQKNKHNKNVFDVAKLYQAEEIVLYLAKVQEDMKIREYNL